MSRSCEWLSCLADALANVWRQTSRTASSKASCFYTNMLQLLLHTTSIQRNSSSDYNQDTSSINRTAVAVKNTNCYVLWNQYACHRDCPQSAQLQPVRYTSTGKANVHTLTQKGDNYLILSWDQMLIITTIYCCVCCTPISSTLW